MFIDCAKSAVYGSCKGAELLVPGTGFACWVWGIIGGNTKAPGGTKAEVELAACDGWINWGIVWGGVGFDQCLLCQAFRFPFQARLPFPFPFWRGATSAADVAAFL